MKKKLDYFFVVLTIIPIATAIYNYLHAKDFILSLSFALALSIMSIRNLLSKRTFNIARIIGILIIAIAVAYEVDVL